MGLPWGHTFVDGDAFNDVENVIPFLQALNERALACGYDGVLFPTSAAALRGLACLGPSAVGDPLGTSQSFGNYMSVPVISWPAIQALTAIVAYKYMANHAKFDLLNLGTWLDFDSYDTWPPPNGFTRKREPEITDNSVSMPDGSRVRFTQSIAPVFSDYLNITMPATASGGQNATKIMLRVGGAWIVDPDQTTPLSLWTMPHGGLIKPGDVVGPWIPNDIYQGLKRLDSIVLTARGVFDTPYGFFSYPWPVPDPWIEYNRREGQSGQAASFGPPVVPYNSASDARDAAELDFAAHVEVPSNADTGGGAGFAAGLAEFYQAGWLGTDFLGPGTGECFSASMVAVHIRMNAATGFRGFLLGSNVHAMTSAADVYYAASKVNPPASVHNIQTYSPRPATMTPENTIVKVDTIVSNTDDRQGVIWFGDTAIQPFPPPQAFAPPGEPWSETVGARLRTFLILQRFNVSGGFQFL
jgi:hypothetical protein